MKQVALLVGLFAVALAPAPAAAEPILARLYRGEYGYEPSCYACHEHGGGSELGAYGRDLKQAGKNREALAAIAARDSDGDGFGNLAEIRAKANPGSKDSTPKMPGDWLATAKLVPREVHEAFPGATAYKLLDAIFTAKEVERAKAIGVALGAEDENTIYVPVAGGKAQGAAILVPAAYRDKRFYVLLAADRGLGVKTVSLADTKNVPEAERSSVLSTFAGKPLKEVERPPPSGSVDGAIGAAVKKAATILWVRLTRE